LAKSYRSANLPKCPEQRFANDRQLDLDQWRISESYAIRLLSEVARSGAPKLFQVIALLSKSWRLSRFRQAV
jgi:hypothetical protein